MPVERREDHRKNPELERILSEINGLLGSVEGQVLTAHGKNKYPVVLVMGCPRSGTTLFMQWLSCLGYFAYPSNLLSRFYGAPYIGAKIQLMLTKYDFNSEIFDFAEEVPFVSRLGKTRGVLAPNEFWYFWRRFFNFGEIQKLTDDELEKIDSRTFVAEIAAMEEAFGKPISMKGMIVNWHIPYLAKILDKVLFVHIKRHPFFNAQSLLRSRIDYYGDISSWYSFKPPEYSSLSSRDPYEQVCGQVYFTNKAIEEGRASIGSEKSLSVQYEDFCADPASVFEQIATKFREQKYDADWSYDGPASFTVGNQVCLSDEDEKSLLDAYRTVSGETITV